LIPATVWRRLAGLIRDHPLSKIKRPTLPRTGSVHPASLRDGRALSVAGVRGGGWAPRCCCPGEPGVPT